MSAYTKIKTVSKILIYFSVFVLVLTGGAYFYLQNQISADTETSGENYRTSDGINLIIKYPPKMNLGEIYTMYVTTGQIPTDHISIFIAETNVFEGQWANIDASLVCKEVVKVKNGQQSNLHLHDIVNCPNNKCNNTETSKKPDQNISTPGEHRIVAVAIKSEETFTNDCSNINNVIIAINKGGIIEGVSSSSSTTNGSQTTGGTTSGNGDSSGSNRAGFETFRLNFPSWPIDTTGKLIDIVFKVFLMIVEALSVIAIIVGGIFYISSAGNPENAEKGKKTVLYAVIGIVIVTLSFVIEHAVLDIINQIT